MKPYRSEWRVFDEEYLIIQDKLIDIVVIAESMMDIISERFKRQDFDISQMIKQAAIPTDLDVLFSSVMNSFQQTNGDHYADLIYIGTPDGKLFGSKTDGQIYIRDNSTDWKYKHFATDPNTLKRTNTSSKIYQA